MVTCFMVKDTMTSCCLVNNTMITCGLVKNTMVACGLVKDTMVKVTPWSQQYHDHVWYGLTYNNHVWRDQGYHSYVCCRMIPWSHVIHTKITRGVIKDIMITCVFIRNTIIMCLMVKDIMKTCGMINGNLIPCDMIKDIRIKSTLYKTLWLWVMTKNTLYYRKREHLRRFNQDRRIIRKTWKHNEGLMVWVRIGIEPALCWLAWSRTEGSWKLWPWVLWGWGVRLTDHKVIGMLSSQLQNTPWFCLF